MSNLRIKGLYKDYFIIIGVNHIRNASFPQRDFFWAYEDFKFAPLEAVSQELIPILENINSYFTGEHDKVIQSRGSQAAQDFDPENIDRKF